MKYLGKIQDNKDLVTKEYVDNADNNKVDKVSGKGLSTNDYTTAEKNKLAGIAAGAQVNTITGVKGDAESSYRTGNVNLTAKNVAGVSVGTTSVAGYELSACANQNANNFTGTIVGHINSNKPNTSADHFLIQLGYNSSWKGQIAIDPRTNQLYTRVLNNGTWGSWTEIGTVNAINLLNNRLVSRGEQLVVNGSGMLGDNTNWSNWTFDGSHSNSSPGSFTRTSTSYANILTDEFFPVDANLSYRFDMDAITANHAATMYSYLNFYDVDKYAIIASYYMYYSGTLTTLARELKAGDTKVYLTNASAYETKGTGSHQRALIFWDYKNSFGYQYPPETYSRNILMPAWTDNSSIDKVNNVITLTTAYTGITHPAGTYVSQGNSGGTYKYSGMVGNIPPATWTHYTGHYDGIDYSGLNKGDTFCPGTAYCKVGFLWNYNSANDQIWVTNVSVKENYRESPGIFTLQSNYNNPYSTLKAWAADNTDAGNWTVASTSGIKIGDTVRIKCVATDVANTIVYVYGTVTSINNATSLRMTSHGLETCGISTNVRSSGTAANSTSRHVWFSASGEETSRAHSDNFMYNPSANTISANAISASHLKAYSGNEVTVGANGITAGSSSNDSVWINYRDVEGGSTSNAATKITNYYFGNRKGNVSDVTVHATSFNGTAANASKVNNLTVQTAVPANAVFTDTVTTATTSGSGNAVTAISATNGALTVTKGTTFLTSHQDISGKADKSATVSTVTWDSTNKKLTKTINGTTTDVVTAATLRTGLNVADGAEVNQNAFSNVKVGSTTVAADSKTDTLELVAGSNVTLTPDATNDKVTIAATATTYESKAAASGGTAVSLVTTGEKYTWNNKSSLALGETSSTAYRGDRGKTAYDHSQATHARTDATAVASSSTNGNIKINGTETTVYTHPGSGTNPHGTTKSDVGLGNVGNFKAVSTAASQGLTSTEQSNARANIGAGTSSLTLGTSGTTAAYGNHNHTGVYSPVGHTHDGINIDIDNGGSYIPVSNIEAGNNVTLDYNNQTDTLTINATGGGGGTTDYSNLSNKPQINSNTLSGNKTSADLGLQSALSVESQTLTVNSTYFSLYSGSPYTTTDATIKLRRYGKVVSITGMVKPKSAINGSDTEYTICTVPTGYRPTQCIIQVMQGSTQYRWCLKVNSGGSVTFSRYAASTSYAQASTSAWLPFHATWIID